MKKSFAILFILLSSFVYGQNKAYDYAYINKKGICVYSIADKKEYFLINNGSDPCISPDGKKLAYTVSGTDMRYIAIMDLNSRKIIKLNAPRNDGHYGPVWSPDGKQIAYNIYDFKSGKWSIAVINSDNTNSRVLNVKDYYSPTWLNNNTNLVVQNMSQVSLVDLSGKVVTTYKSSQFEVGVPELKDAGHSSSDIFVFTKDNKKVVFSSSVDEWANDYEPLNAVFVHDLILKKTLRLSPKGYSAYGLEVKGNKVFFNMIKVKGVRTDGIYSVDMDGKNLKMLFPNCFWVSVRN